MLGKKTKKTALVYFSLNGNTDYVAERLAEALRDQVELDVIRLEPVKPYADKGFRKFMKGGADATFGAKPELKLYNFDPRDYDTVVIGTPIWAGTVAPPLRTFMLHNRLKGKNIAIFVNSMSGNSEKCLSKFEKYLKKTNIIATMSLVEPMKAKSGEDLYTIRKFAEEIMEKKQ